MYNFIGCALHRGSFGYGHYIAVVKHNESWFECDDSHVYPISQSSAISKITEEGWRPVFLAFKKVSDDLVPETRSVEGALVRARSPNKVEDNIANTARNNTKNSIHVGNTVPEVTPQVTCAWTDRSITDTSILKNRQTVINNIKRRFQSKLVRDPTVKEWEVLLATCVDSNGGLNLGDLVNVLKQFNLLQ